MRRLWPWVVLACASPALLHGSVENAVDGSGEEDNTTEATATALITTTSPSSLVNSGNVTPSTTWTAGITTSTTTWATPWCSWCPWCCLEGNTTATTSTATTTFTTTGTGNTTTTTTVTTTTTTTTTTVVTTTTTVVTTTTTTVTTTTVTTTTTTTTTITSTFFMGPFRPGATKVILSFNVMGISYSRLNANPKTYRAVSNAIQEGIAHVAAGGESSVFSHITKEQVAVKITQVPARGDAIKVYAAISSPLGADPMLLWQKMVQSLTVRQVVETKISFADGIGSVATGAIAIDGGILVSAKEVIDITTTPLNANLTVAVVDGACHAFPSALLVGSLAIAAILT